MTSIKIGVCLSEPNFTSESVFSTAEMSFGAACIFLRGGKNIVSTAAIYFFTFDECSFLSGCVSSCSLCSVSVAASDLYFCMRMLNICFFPQCIAKTAGR